MLVVAAHGSYAIVNNTCLFLSASVATELDFLSPLLLKVYRKFARCREGCCCSAVVNADTPVVWSLFGQLVSWAPASTSTCLGLKWSMHIEPIGRETNTLKISSINVGLCVNITICFDNWKKQCLFSVPLHGGCDLHFVNLPSLCLSFQVIYGDIFWVKSEVVTYQTGSHLHTHCVCVNHGGAIWSHCNKLGAVTSARW